MSYIELRPQLIKKSLVFPKKLKPMLYSYPHVYDQNERCEFHEGSPRHTSKDCKTLKYRVKELIGNKFLTFKRNGLKVDNSTNGSCNAQGKGSWRPLVVHYSEETNKVWEDNNANISKASVLVQNNPMISFGKDKGMGSLSKEKIPKYDKGKSSSMPYPAYPYITVASPIETPLKLPCKQKLIVPPQGYVNKY